MVKDINNESSIKRVVVKEMTETAIQSVTLFMGRKRFTSDILKKMGLPNNDTNRELVNRWVVTFYLAYHETMKHFKV